MTDRTRAFELIHGIHYRLTREKTVLDELDDIVGRNQNEGCGGDRTLVKQEWLNTRNVIWEIKRTIEELQTCLGQFTAETEAIESFFGKYRFLSNFYPSPVYFDGYKYPTVEHAFQAAKTTDDKDRVAIRNTPDPKIAKRIGRSVVLRPDWERVKVTIMYELVYQKFSRNDELRRMLLETRDRPLVEGNTWGDNFWGCIPDPNGKLAGKNTLGKILMSVREKVR